MAKLAWRTALSLSPLWSLRLPMALAFQLRQPSRAQPLPGLCHNLPGTNSCGKCAYVRVRYKCALWHGQKRGKSRGHGFTLALSCWSGAVGLRDHQVKWWASGEEGHRKLPVPSPPLLCSGETGNSSQVQDTDRVFTGQ